jgi:hypothetical protein
MTTRDEIQRAIAIQLAIHGLQEARRLLERHVVSDAAIVDVCYDIIRIMTKLETHESSLGSIFNVHSEVES